MPAWRARKKRRPTRRQRRKTPRPQWIRSTIDHAFRALLLAALLSGSWWILDRAQSHVQAKPQAQQTVQFELVDAPHPLADIIQAALADLTATPWIDHRLCPLVHDRLRANGWVRSVERVRKTVPGTVQIQCEYRLPVAMVQHGEYFYLIDEYGVRLPGRHGFEPNWLLLQGVRTAPPTPGARWYGRDLRAGVRLANRFRTQPFADQVAVILLHNYGGRRDPYGCHIELLTTGQVSRILWGSAPGEEIEENSVVQKMHILAENYRQHGRIDAGYAKIDVSVFANRFLTPS